MSLSHIAASTTLISRSPQRSAPSSQEAEDRRRSLILKELYSSRFDFDHASWRKHLRERQKLRARGR